MIARRWVLPEPAPHGLGEWPGLHSIIAEILYRRGCHDLAAARSFLLVDADLTHDPSLLPDVDRAVDRLVRAIRHDEAIAIYGDYDADGLCAAALLVDVVRELGGRVQPYIPNRFTEGYGLNMPALTGLAGQGVKLVVTVDAGIQDAAEVDHARSLGLDVIVTDHHTLGPRLPDAVAAINPHRPDCVYPFKKLAGVGVAFKLAQALFRTRPPVAATELLDLVAIGTVADIAPLLGENRYFVRHGLDVLRAGHRPGLAALCRRAGIDPTALDSRHLSHVIGPRLNAAGRLGNALTSYDLLTTRDPARAAQLADELEAQNARRQQLVAGACDVIDARIGALDALPPLLIFWDTAFHRGVAGPVAARLVDQYGRPAVVIAVVDGVCYGSARSPEGFDIHLALSRCADLLLRFGGHRAAAGLTLTPGNLEALHARLAAIAVEHYAGHEPAPILAVDAALSLAEIDDALWRQLRLLAPFGTGNPRPQLLVRNVAVADARPLGAEGKHVKLRLVDGAATRTAIAWNRPDLLAVSGRIDVVAELEENIWRGERELRLRIADVKPSDESAVGSRQSAVRLPTLDE
ncbi:MAG: single-stranded-DNA-specific exonuclease RecJ [Chloroflexi bacterium]|nr:single-stranded-DNA-specific exonuclease RecJ [Chloroflexota bacterium]